MSRAAAGAGTRPEPGAAVRAAAARVLVAVRFDGKSLKAALPRDRDPLPDPRDRALCEAIVFTACRWLPRYERLLGRLLARPLPNSARPVHGLLLAGLAQLDGLELPAYAAIDASAEAARELRLPRLVGLVNAVLRRYQRERDALHAGLADDDEFIHAHPRWLLDALRAAWPQDWQSIVAANNREAPLWLRINRRRLAPAAYDALLREAGLDAEPVDGLPVARRLTGGSLPAERLPGWQQGLVSIQDAAAQRCATALDPRPGDRVLDACAAPGGKTAALLESVDGIDLLALDLDPARLARVEQALARLGLSATLACANAAKPDGWWDGCLFDRILLDAPCSATGVIRRQPDIRWHRRASDLAELTAVQRRLLNGLWPLLRPGGRLVYATCSVLPDENARPIDAFLARHHDAVALDLGADFGRRAGAGRQRLPGELDMDGFFYAALEKRG
jgi:16S rRNA (cytosine967-C5)-methyltransferase